MVRVAGKFSPHILQRAVFRLQAPFELGIFDLRKDFLEARPGHVPGRDQVIAADERCGTNCLRGYRGDSPAGEVVGSQVAVTGQAVQSVQLEVLLKIGHAHKTHEGGLLHLRHMRETHVVGH